MALYARLYINGVVQEPDLSITDFEMGGKGLYSACKFRISTTATGDFDIDIHYSIQAKCHLIFDQDGSWN